MSQLDSSDDWTSVGEPAGDVTLNSTLGDASMQEPIQDKIEEKSKPKDSDGGLADSQEWTGDSIELLS